MKTLTAPEKLIIQLHTQFSISLTQRSTAKLIEELYPELFKK